MSADHIASLLRATVSLAGREIDILPSTSLLNDMAGEAGELSRQQVGEILSQEKDITLQRDSTTKGGHHVQGKDCSLIQKTVVTTQWV